MGRALASLASVSSALAFSLRLLCFLRPLRCSFLSVSLSPSFEDAEEGVEAMAFVGFLGGETLSYRHKLFSLPTLVRFLALSGSK